MSRSYTTKKAKLPQLKFEPITVPSTPPEQTFPDWAQYRQEPIFREQDSITIEIIGDTATLNALRGRSFYLEQCNWSPPTFQYTARGGPGWTYNLSLTQLRESQTRQTPPLIPPQIRYAQDRRSPPRREIRGSWR